MSRDLEQEDVQNIMNQLQNSSYNKSIVRKTYYPASFLAFFLHLGSYIMHLGITHMDI